MLGATGSIGQSTLDIIRQHPERFRLFSAAAFSSVEKMAEIVREFRPEFVVMGSAEAAQQLQELVYPIKVDIDWGERAICAVAADAAVDQVMAAVMGFAGLAPTLAAIRAGKRILLANKESLVTAGHLFMEAVRSNGVTLLPIDSEHNAIFQSLPQSRQGAELKKVRQLLLTASGGPFRNWSLSEMENVTPAQACKHPNWSMGQKISVDSASLMNKGLELIEACWLFDVEPSQVDVVVHPESIIHSMVSYIDGSVIAQLGNPDMRVPIAYGMSWPDRMETGVAPLDLVATAQLNFEKPDLQKFPNLRLAADAWYLGGTAMSTLNAANEIAVAAFLKGEIGFLDIARINESVLEKSSVKPVTSLDVVFESDRVAREMAAKFIIDKVAS